MSTPTKGVQNQKLKLLIMLICLTLILYGFTGEKGDLIEKLAIPLGIGFDIESESPVKYKVTFEVYTVDEKTINYITTTESSTLGETRELRSAKLEKKVVYGLERVYLIGEKKASFGIRNILDLWLVTPLVNDRAYVAVCNGKAFDTIKSNFNSIASSSKYIEGLIKNSYIYNFFPKRFVVIDILSAADSEGKTLLIPYIEIGAEGPEITGYGIFSEDKMKIRTSLNEAKFINLMTFNKVKGIITVQPESKAYANIYCESRRKVKCYKENNKYKFVIDLKLKGEVLSNGIYEDINTNTESVKQLEKDVEEVVLKECNKYIDKVKKQYGLDVLSLGQTAAAKYGRDKGIDWNKTVNESDIKVNVDVEIVKQGRGEY
jgi:Ger(x)C family germination protein